MLRGKFLVGSRIDPGIRRVPVAALAKLIQQFLKSTTKQAAGRSLLGVSARPAASLVADEFGKLVAILIARNGK